MTIIGIAAFILACGFLYALVRLSKVLHQAELSLRQMREKADQVFPSVVQSAENMQRVSKNLDLAVEALSKSVLDADVQIRKTINTFRKKMIGGIINIVSIGYGIKAGFDVIMGKESGGANRYEE